MQSLASVADRFQMTGILSVLEEALVGQLSMGVCGWVLTWSGFCGMRQLEEEVLKMVAWRFEEFAKTADFLRIREEALMIILDDDRLVAKSEETVWEAVVGWMRGAEGRRRGRGVAGKVRFPLMGDEYLGGCVLGVLDEQDGEWMAGVVAEALRAKAAAREGAVYESKLLGRKALEDRVGLGVRWEDYREGGERRLRRHNDEVRAIVACEDWICSGSGDGAVRVYGRASGQHERTPRVNADGDDVTGQGCALALLEGRLISGHESGVLLVWDAETGRLDRVLEGHTAAVQVLAVCGSRLASGSDDGSIRVWAMAAGGAPWACERKLVGDAAGVHTLAAAGGAGSGSIRVWDARSGAHAATLAGN